MHFTRQEITAKIQAEIRKWHNMLHVHFLPCSIQGCCPLECTVGHPGRKLLVGQEPTQEYKVLHHRRQ